MRIVAGQWRGRSLRAPPGMSTRPTSDRARQSLFDMLRHAPWSAGLLGASVLDAFAGTGALGLEALSRGAARAVFIEQDRAALATLRANIAACGAADTSRVIEADVCRPPAGDRCDLIFLDPPYGRDLAAPAVAALRRAGWCAPEAVIVAELGYDDALPQLGQLLEDRRHGAARITVWRSENR